MSGQWKVKLGGSFIPYEESSVHEALEAALAGGQDSTEVVVRGTTYTVELKATPMRQVQKADPTKWREVRREAPSSPDGAGPSSHPANQPLEKRGAEAAEGSSPAKKAKIATAEATLVFAPGAGGSTAKAMRKLQDGVLSSLGLRVFRCDDHAPGASEARWVTQAPGNSRNVSHLLAVAGRAAAAHPGRQIFLIGASFGNRVAAEALRTHGDELRKLGVQDALIACGYPLIPAGKPDIGQPGYDAKRPAHLVNLPSSVRVLFLQGSLDEFNGPRGIRALRELLPQMKATAELVEVPNGVHTLPGTKNLKAIGKKQADIEAAIGQAIVEFVSR